MSPELFTELKQRIADVVPAVTRLRHLLHTHPELHFQEFETRRQLVQALQNTTIDFRQPLLGTDLIGELPGASDRCIVLRADIDALPIIEQTSVPHKSHIPGMMHACGHDGHMAIMTGVATVLDQLRQHLPVHVRFVFQPGEEMVVGGRDLVAKGACDGAEAAFALHGGPGRPTGSISSMPGAMLAASDFFEVTFTGQGGHGAMPERALSPIPAAAAFVQAMAKLHVELQTENGSVASICCVKAGEAPNVIPDSASLSGTTRFLEAGFGDQIESRMRHLAHEIAALHGVQAHVDYKRKYDLPLINSEESVSYLRDLVRRHIGDDSWHDEPGPTMVSEDFAFYLQNRAGAMFWLGLGEEQPGLHSPFFDFNDEAIPNAILAFCLIALNYDQAQRP